MSWSKRARVRALEFTDAITDNVLTFKALPEKGCLQYSVNGGSLRPPSRQILFEGARVSFPDIARQAAIPEDGSDSVVAGLLGLADAICIQPMVQFTDPDERNSLTFRACSNSSLQYTVNGKDLRPAFQLIVFEGDRISFPSIGNRRARLPRAGAKYLSEQLLQLAFRARIEVVVQFTDPDTRNLLEFRGTPQGCLQYTVNGKSPRPAFRKILFEGEHVRFLDIGKSATLPQDGTRALVAAQLSQLAKLVGIRTPVEFVDPGTGNTLTFWAKPDGNLEYTVNWKNPRPHFRRIQFTGPEVRFPEIRRGARLDTRVDQDSSFAQLMLLAKSVGIQPEVCFIDARTQNSLSFSVPGKGFLQYTVNGKHPRPPCRQIIFQGPYISFPDIQKCATLPNNETSDCLVAQLLVLARENGIDFEIRFTDPDSKNKLSFREAPGGCLQYTVNGEDPRPPFRQMTFAGRYVSFPDIGKDARLPGSISVMSQLMILARLVGIRPQVQFVDPSSGNILSFKTLPDGSCQYEVNGKDPRPPFRQISFAKNEIRFHEILRSAALPKDSARYLAVQLSKLVPEAGAREICAKRPSSMNSHRTIGSANASGVDARDAVGDASGCQWFCLSSNSVAARDGAGGDDGGCLESDSKVDSQHMLARLVICLKSFCRRFADRVHVVSTSSAAPARQHALAPREVAMALEDL